MQKKLDNKVDYSTVVIREDLKSITEEQLSYIKKESSIHSNYLRNSFSDGTLTELLVTRAREIAFIGNKYKHLSNAEKELLAANIVFPDDEKFIRILLSKNITYAKLFTYSRAVTNIKKVKMYARRLNADVDVQVTNKKISNLCSLFRLYYGISDYNLIIAKINEIVTFQKDLYRKIEQGQDTLDSKTR